MPLKWAVSAVFAAAFVAALGYAWLRWRAFKRLLRYNPQHGQAYALGRMGGKPSEVICHDDGFEIPAFADANAAAFLPLVITSTFSGKFFDPWIEMELCGVTRRQYFERGACGTRYLNLSGFFTGPAPPKGRMRLRGGRCTWREQRTWVFAFSERLAPSEKVAVIAPHPDDAEIAAFGVYSSTDAVVVTVTAGDATESFGSAVFGGLRAPRTMVAKARVWDSVTIPRFGGVELERAVNLAYPDGELAAMFAEPDRVFNARSTDGVDFAALRAMNLSQLMPHEKTSCSWRSLVADLERIFRAVKPTVIVTPYPGQDPHPDHLFTTAAVAEAMHAAELSDTRVLLAVVHNRWSELYPFGPAGSEMSLPPLFEATEVECDGLCVVPLSDERQRGKHLALEAMHDVRDVQASSRVDWPTALKRCRTQIHAAIHGLGLPPTSYLRRAVRPQELFFVVHLDRLGRLVEQSTHVPAPK